jgi:hypothetical protein
MPEDMRQLIIAANMAPVQGAGAGNEADELFLAGGSALS